jgi:hypothetical protein
MGCVTHTVNAFGSFANSGPVSGYATDGVTSQSASDGPKPVPVGLSIVAEAKVPGDGSRALGHGDVAVRTGYAILTARACTDGVAGRKGQGSATEGTVRVTASPYTVQFQHKAIRFSKPDLDMFTQLRIVQLNVGEFDPRSFPDTGEPDSPLEKTKAYLKPVVPPDENVLLVQQFTLDGQGNLTVDTYGSAVDQDAIVTANDFKLQKKNGTYLLLPDAKRVRTLSVNRPTGEYFVRFQFTWGYGVLPPPPSDQSNII